MEKTFNPSEQNKVDLERSILDLRSKKSGLVFKKIKKQEKATDLKVQLTNPHLELEEYDTLKGKRNKVRCQLSQIEVDIKEVNLEINAKNKLFTSIQSHLKVNKNKLSNDTSFLRELIVLKEQYNEFSADHTRVSSMRTMASNFTNKLESIINKYAI
ncbi:hypothetical protein [Polaribacter sp. IC073]|uniref:hypothetical protein n=1 Tax=Polaribacter sp. IC073 TaxID=2508540 RepID=UPI0011BD8A86|nr:hypothetical protein [Polaribacter sp. IC073]TXD45879.1 hypothetical protein ES045_15760 [Polaribacter sp. IC073]